VLSAIIAVGCGRNWRGLCGGSEKKEERVLERKALSTVRLYQLFRKIITARSR